MSDEQWSSFLNDEVTPRFPDGLSVIDMAGQYRGSSGAISRERSKLLIVIVFEPSTTYGPKVQAVIDAYKRRFHQESVLRVEHGVCAGL